MKDMGSLKKLLQSFLMEKVKWLHVKMKLKGKRITRSTKDRVTLKTANLYIRYTCEYRVKRLNKATKAA